MTLSETGNGYYTSAYNVYNILLILSSYSMPVAISKMISARLAKGEWARIAAVFLKTGLFVQLLPVDWQRLCCGLVLIFCRIDQNTIFQLCFKKRWRPPLDPWRIWEFKGYFQGTGTMIPTAIPRF